MAIPELEPQPQRNGRDVICMTVNTMPVALCRTRSPKPRTVWLYTYTLKAALTLQVALVEAAPGTTKYSRIAVELPLQYPKGSSTWIPNPGGTTALIQGPKAPQNCHEYLHEALCGPSKDSAFQNFKPKPYHQLQKTVRARTTTSKTWSRRVRATTGCPVSTTALALYQASVCWAVVNGAYIVCQLVVCTGVVPQRRLIQHKRCLHMSLALLLSTLYFKVPAKHIYLTALRFRASMHIRRPQQ